MSTVKSTKKSPQIRFKGFNEEWSQKKYTDTFDTSVSNNTLSRAELTAEKTSTQNVHYGDILIKYNSILNVKNEDIPYIPEDIKIDSKNLLKNGDIIFADTAEDETCGKATEINNVDDEKLVAGLHTFVARPKIKFEEQYLGYFINSPAYHNQLLPFMQGTKVTSISKTSIQKTWINYPLSTEQNKIGDLFSQIDSLIASTQKEHDKLVTLKKCMLNKMFPKKGSLVPEIRFKGFTGDWVEVTVNDLVEERNQQIPQSESFPLMAFIAYQGVAPKGERYDRSSLVNDVDNKLYKITKYGDFIYSSNNLETGSIGLNTYGDAVISPVYSIFMTKKDVDAQFIGRLFVKKEFIKEMVKWRQGVIYGQWRIHESDFIKIKVLAPKYEEQKKIGLYFQNLDNLISKQATELEKLKNVKKTLLSKMFV